MHFDLYPDGAFVRDLRVPAEEEIVYTRVDQGDHLRKMLLTPTESSSIFDTHVGELMRGSTSLICPKQDDKDPVCLTFSLRGFTAALKAICPKR